MQAGRRSGIHAEEGEIDLFLSCYATPLQQGERDEKLALAVSFEAAAPRERAGALIAAGAAAGMACNSPGKSDSV